jgi:thiosulfate dehydrogenase [quinone] large subunit
MLEEQTLVAFLLPLRLYAGWVYLVASLSKMAGGWLSQPTLRSIVEGWLAGGKPYGFYAPFLQKVVIPHATLFTVLVVIGELLVGIGLLAGVLTRAAAVLGILLTLNFLLGRGDGAGANSTSPFIAVLLTLVLTRPGRVLGLDAALEHKLPRWLV